MLKNYTVATIFCGFVTISLIWGSMPGFVLARAVSSAAAKLAGATTPLYDGSQGTTPNGSGQQFNYFTYPLSLNPPAGQSFANGVTTLNTSVQTSDTAGYFVKPGVVTLDRSQGYSVRFTAQVIQEQHPLPGSDKNNDGIGDRAGFSLIVLSSDKKGIELGFWTNEIWAQQDGTAQPPGGTLFTHAEGASFNTTGGLTTYELAVLGNSYTLFSGSTTILSGSLRDYTAFNTPPFAFIYNTPDFIFLGDDTTSAQATIGLSAVSVITPLSLPTITTQPADQTILIGQSATLSVVASSNFPLSYQWYQITGGTTATPIPGAINSTYTTPTLTQSSSYRVRVSNLVGPVDSTIATIMVALLVTLPDDNGQADTPGTLSYALARVGNRQAITFDPNISSVTVKAGSLPPLQSGAKIQGRCVAGQPTVTITGNDNGNRRPGNGLVLSGNNTLNGLKVTGFGGVQIKAGPGNKLACVVATFS